MYSYTCTNTKFKNSTQKKLILKSLYFYTYIKRTPKNKPELPSLCSRRDHTEYTGSIVGLSDIVVGLCINYRYSMQGSIGQPAKVRNRVRGKNKTIKNVRYITQPY